MVEPVFHGIWGLEALPAGLQYFIMIVLEILAIIVPFLLAVAMGVYAERKIWGAIHLRRGPNVVGPFGLLQSFADGLKLFVKETIIPSGANKAVFFIAPIITFALALIAWAVVPFDAGVVLADINVGILYLFAISSLGVYGIIMSGWASNSRYAFLGGLRSAAQMVSYEVSIGFVIVSVLLCVGSLRISDVVLAQQSTGIVNHWFFVPLFPMFVIFLISAMAETNRAPFDLPEAESELVAGYQTEYSSMAFALFWLGEYGNITADVRHDVDPVPRRMAAAVQHRAVHLDSGCRLVLRQDRIPVLRLRLGEDDRAPLSLRPAHASRLEGIPAGVAGMVVPDRRRAGLFRPAAEALRPRMTRRVSL